MNDWVDKPRRRQRDFLQRALGRLLSAAREIIPTQPVRGCVIEPSSGLQFSGLQALWEEGLMPRPITPTTTLESLVLMYCRDTTDAATQHIAALPKLKKYFASYTRITDRTPQILSGVASLEEIELDSCAGLTNAGIAALARLPRLRELRLSGMPRVTGDIAASGFAPHVRVSHSP
jgi:hypothetical protein